MTIPQAIPSQPPTLREAGVYRILNRENGRVYIGETSHLGNRLRAHQNLLRRGKHRNRKLQSDYSTMGASFVFEAVAVVHDARERHTLEVGTIQSLFGEGCYNIVVDNALPRTHSEEARAKIRVARGLQVSPKGWKHSEDFKRNRSLVMTGKPVLLSTLEAAIRANVGSKRSLESRARMSVAQTGKSASAETRAKIGASKRGKHLSEETKKKIALGNLGRVHTPEAIEKWSAKQRGRPQTRVTCPNCGKTGGKSIMRRWHFEACKEVFQ